MNAKHTPEPWAVEPCRLIGSGTYAAGHISAIVEIAGRAERMPVVRLASLREAPANAARIVACVNALAGIADPEGFIRSLIDLAHVAVDCDVRPGHIAYVSRAHIVMLAKRALALLGQ